MKARREQIHISGSCAEGGMVSRFFMEETPGLGTHTNYWVDGINKEAEFDMEYTILDLTPNLKDLIVEIPEKPGYVRLREHPEYLANAQSLGWDVHENYKLKWEQMTEMIGIFYEDDYIRTYQLKVYFINKVGIGLANGRCPHCLKSLIAGVLRKSRSDFDIEFHLSRTNATAEAQFRIEIEGEKFLKVTYDCVPMIRLQWWPDIANEWKERQRVWPSESVIQELAQIGYIIGKPQNKGDKNATDMRYAFSHIEHKLVNIRNKRQKMIYLILKIIWVKHVKSLNPKKISSFMAKTVMFWQCEEIHPDNKWWSRHPTEILKDLFRRMLRVFDDDFLPYYFVPSINVLHEVPRELIDNEIKPQLRKIILNIDDYVPKCFDKITAFAKTVLQTFEPVSKAFDDFKKRDYSFFLRQPNLIVDELSYIICEEDVKILKTIRKTLEGTDYINNEFLCDESCQKLVARWNDIATQILDRKISQEASTKRFIKKILGVNL